MKRLAEFFYKFGNAFNLAESNKFESFHSKNIRQALEEDWTKVGEDFNRVLDLGNKEIKNKKKQKEYRV